MESPLHRVVNERQEVTCAQGLQQLVSHFKAQLLACCNSAPEVPATAPGTIHRVRVQASQSACV